jgi:hypothetical protein
LITWVPLPLLQLQALAIDPAAPEVYRLQLDHSFLQFQKNSLPCQTYWVEIVRALMWAQKKNLSSFMSPLLTRRVARSNLFIGNMFLEGGLDQLSYVAILG